MANSLPPPKNVAFSFEHALVSQSDTDVFQTSVTLAAGDVQVSKDGGSFANIGSLPTEISTSGVLTVALTATEMNADRVAIRFHDASGSQWQDSLVIIFTSGQTFDTIDANVDAVLLDTGTDGVILANDAITAAKFDESTAYPVKSADAGATQIARVGADGDTLETLSDQLDTRASSASLATVANQVSQILADTGTDGVVLADDAITAAKFDESTAYPVKSADAGATQIARVGADGDTLETLSDQLDGAATAAALATVGANVDAILLDTGTDGVVLANDAITAAKFDESTAYPVKSADAGATQIARVGADGDTLETLSDQLDEVTSSISGLNDLSAADVNAEVVDVLRTDTIPDSYAADGAQPTLSQAVLAIHQFLMEKAVVGTTLTVRKPDGSTAAMTFTLSDPTDPTSITRAS